MSKRFQKTRIVDKWGGIYDSKTDKVLNVNDVEYKLNEQQYIIQELERKVKKYAKIGEEQLKQIMDLQDKLQECRAKLTFDTDEK